MSETRVGEPKQVGPSKVRKVSRNRKSYGQIIYYPNKVAVYWAKRRLDEYHQLAAGWLVEADTMAAVKLYGVTHVGLLIEGGEKLLTRAATFGPAGIEAGVVKRRSNTYVDPWGRRGAMCWHVPKALWVSFAPDLHTQTENLLERMHVKRDRGTKTVEESLPK
jgi:hypothetical protein